MLKLGDLIRLQKLQSKPALVQLLDIGISKLVLLTASIQLGKVENIYEDSLNLIPSPSPSVKIQIIGGKVYLR